MSPEWKQGVCGCCDDCDSCLCGYFCPCLLIMRNGDDLGRSGLACCLVGCFLPCVSIFLLRQEARERYGIDGTTANDALCSCCCGALVNCQTAAEIKERGDRGHDQGQRRSFQLDW